MFLQADLTSLQTTVLELEKKVEASFQLRMMELKETDASLQRQVTELGEKTEASLQHGITELKKTDASLQSQITELREKKCNGNHTDADNNGGGKKILICS